MVNYIYYTEKDGQGQRHMAARPVRTREEYMALRDSEANRQQVDKVRHMMAEGATDDEVKREKFRLVKFAYNDLMPDGAVKNASHPGSTFFHDIDLYDGADVDALKQKALQMKEELGLLELSGSVSGGLHLVCRRQPGRTILENQVRVATLLQAEMDTNNDNLERIVLTTTSEDLFYLDDELFTEPMTVEQSKQEMAEITLRQMYGQEEVPEGAKKANKHFCPWQKNEKLDMNHEQWAGAETEVAKVTVPSLKERGTPGRAGGESSPSFKGIPYASIIAEWWHRTGGEPVEGERNVKLYQLAVNLRAICDNKKEVLMQVMPRFGLSDAEMRSVIDSACKEPPKGISKMMAAIVDELAPLLSPEGDTDPKSFDDVELQDNRSPLGGLKGGPARSLPLGLKESLIGVPPSMHMPVLCAVLPIAAAYADQVEVEYCDGQRQHLGLMSIIRGEQASGKSVCKNAVDVWKRQFDEEDALARKREEEWKERKKSRKANEKAPEDPHVLIRMLPVTVSCSTLLKRFKNASNHTLYSFCEELDTLRKTNGAGSWSSKYDIYRLSFDRGEWGQDYNSDQAESGVVKVAYNWTMLGTNGAMRKCFKQDNIENGLSSRILVAEMPDSAFSKMPRFGRRSAEDEAKIQEAVTRLRSVSGFVDTPRLRRAIDEWVEQKRVEAAKDIDHVKDTYRKRAAVIGFRCGVIHHLLRGGSSESKSSVDFALMMADYALSQQIAAFGEALQSQYVEASSECQRYGCNHSVFDQLPPSFTLDDLRALKRGFCNDTSLRKIISRWSRDLWIEKTDKGRWRKVTNDE